PTLIENLRASAVAQISIYDASGSVYYTSLELDTPILADLPLSPDTINQTLASSSPVSSPMTIGTTRYRTLLTPFNYGNRTLGVVAIHVPDNVPFASTIGRQLSSFFAAIMAGTVVFISFILVDRYAARLDRV